jgi:NAD(P)-dependent dehydrogenase (short-subunit alcohol dehydrogenase family)
VAGPVLITGCSSGIGRATAEHLARRGFTVYATARRPETLSELEQAGCRTLALDVTDEESMKAAVAEVEGREGAVWALVNNAGYGITSAIEVTDLDALRAEFETNVFGGIRLTQLVLPAMRAARSGRIVNVSSVAGLVTLPGSGPYSASKFALEAFTDALRFEVRNFGIHAVLIEPGPIRTAFTETASPASADRGPYSEFLAAVAKADAETDASALAGDASDVAKAVERALRSRRPKPRYKVTLVARLLPALQGLLPDRAWDAFLRTQATPPGP